MKHLKFIALSLVILFGFWSFANLEDDKLDFMTALNATSQQHLINGKVVDKTTSKPIPFCNVSLISSSVGTSTNELGEFILNVNELPASLVFSHLNYAQFRLEVSEIKNIVIELQPLTTALEEVVVLASKKDVLAIDLAKKAFQKAENSSGKDVYGRAFYRQKSKNGLSYSEFSEIFYDIKYNANGIKAWNIEEGRYALKEDEIYNRNFTIFSRILKPLQPNTVELIFLMHPDLEAHYQLNILDIIQAEDAKIAQIRFKPLPTNSTPTFSGEVYIDMKTFDILKIKGTLARDDLNLVKLSTEEGSWKDYSIAYDINYKRDSIAGTLLDYIKIDQSFDYYKNDSLQYRSSTTSNLTFYEHYTATAKKRLGRRLRSGKSDWKKLDEVGYNESFWANNPLVKRTPIDEEVIRSFEKENAFSSIFLNSDENIALMTSNIADDPFILGLGNKLSAHINSNPIEKVFLHTDKNLISADETLWYSAYVVLGPNKEYSEASKVLHVDLINSRNEIIQSQTHELISGRASGSLTIPKNLMSGNYQLRSYTQWMRNANSDFFFTKDITILSESPNLTINNSDNNKIDLQFFPEGGYLVNGIPSKIAFKAIGADGHNKTIKGRVVDASGNQVALFRTIDRGAGFFPLLPKQGEQYTAILENGEEYPLPKVLTQGYVLTAENLNDKAIKVKVQSSAELHDKTFFIVGQLNQRKYYQGKFEFGKSDIIRFEIPKTKMPSGVLSITLFDENGKPWCERPVFVNNQEELVIQTRFSSQDLAKRDKLGLQVKITDTNGTPVETDFSIAITDAEQVVKHNGAANILTHLLLQSEVKGHINNPTLLFKDQKRGTLNALDLVMLSHAWRKFNWPEVWNSAALEKEFDFAKGLAVSGVAKDLSGRALSELSLRIVAKSEDYLSMFSAETSADGKFEIPDFNCTSETQLVFNALNSSEKLVDVNINLDNNSITLPPAIFSGPDFSVSEEDLSYATFASTRSKMDSIYGSDNITNLNEVTVVADKKEKTLETPSLYGIQPDITIYPEDRGPLTDIFQLLRGFPGLQVTGAGFDTQVSIRNGGSALWIVDSVPVMNGNSIPTNEASVVDTGGGGEQVSPGFSNMRGGTVNLSGLGGANADPASRKATAPVPDFVKTIDVNTIEKIEVHKGASSGAISGLRGQSGVIVIYTKIGQRKIAAPSFDFLGHAAEKEFYSPKYEVPIAKHETPDYRATLYWNPNMRTDANGNAWIEFFNSDVAKNIQVSIEALSAYGLPGAYLQAYGEN